MKHEPEISAAFMSGLPGNGHDARRSRLQVASSVRLSVAAVGAAASFAGSPSCLPSGDSFKQCDPIAYLVDLESLGGPGADPATLADFETRLATVDRLGFAGDYADGSLVDNDPLQHLLVDFLYAGDRKHVCE